MKKFNNKMTIELKDKNGKIVDTRTYSNIITNGYLNLLKSMFNPAFVQMAASSREVMTSYMPRNAFGGVQMFDNYINETKDTLNVDNVLTRGTCHAGGEYAGNDKTRGTLLTNECEFTDQYIKFKWEWGSTKGNGTHKSIALMPVNGGNAGITNGLFNLDDSTIVDTTITDAKAFQIISNETVNGDSAPFISNTGIILGISPDLKYYYTLRGYSASANPLNAAFVDVWEFVDFSNIRMNDYLYAFQPSIGLQRKRSIPIPEFAKASGSAYNWLTYGFNAFDKELYLLNITKGTLRIFNIETLEQTEITLSLPTGSSFGTSNSRVGKIGKWFYVNNYDRTYNGRCIYRFLASDGAYIDNINIPYPAAGTTYRDHMMWQFSPNEIFVYVDTYGYMFDGEKMNGVYYFATPVQKTDLYPLCFALTSNGQFAIANHCLMTIHNFDAPIVKEEGMTMTLTYLIQHAETTT